MKALLRVLLFALAVLAAASASFAQTQPPRNSYLEVRVNSTAELVRQVRTNGAVMDRYRRHFAMSSGEVIDYLSALHVTTLDMDGVYTVYGVPHSSGDFHSRLRLLKKGEPVFAESDGTPVLMLVCGNPLILGPKKPAVPNAVVANTGEVQGPLEMESDAEFVPSPVTPTSEVPSVAPMPEVFPSQPTVDTLPTRPGFSPAPIFGALGTVGIFIHNGGSSNPVPEPIAMLVLGGGLMTVGLRRIFRGRDED